MPITDEQFSTFREAEMKEARDLAISFGQDINLPIVRGSYSGSYPLMDLCLYKSTIHREEKIKLLLQFGADPNVLENYSGTPLMQAVKYDAGIGIINFLLDAKADINMPDDNGKTALYAAIEHRRYDYVRVLIERGANINHKNKNGDTVLTEEIKREAPSLEVINLLMELGADINAANNIHACFGGWRRNSFHLVPLLIDFGANVNARYKDGTSPIALAVSETDCPIDTISVLIKAGAVIDAPDNNGVTPLMKASRSGHIEAVKLLLDLKASVTSNDLEGKSVLHWCCKGGHAKILPLLVNAGADINLQDREGCTPLMYAACDDDVTKALLKFNPDVNKIDEKRRSALMHALSGYSSKKVEVIRALLKRGATVELADFEGNTALHMTAGQYHTPVELIKVLLDAKADPNALNNSGETPLMACRDAKVMEIILKFGASIDVVDKKQKTALIHCVSGYYNDDHQRVKVLLNAKANVDIQDIEGMTALMHAVKSDEKRKSVRLLVDQGANIELLDKKDLSATAHASPENLMLLIAAGAKPRAYEGSKLLNAIYDDNLPLALALLERGAKINLKIEHYIKFKKILEKLARANSVALRSAVNCTDTEAQEQFDSLLAKFGRNRDIADDSDLPEVLRKGAWPVKDSVRKPIILTASRITEIKNSVDYFQGSIMWPEDLRDLVLKEFKKYSAEKNKLDIGAELESSQDYFSSLLKKKGSITLASLFKNWAPESNDSFVEFWNTNAEVLISKICIEGNWREPPMNSSHMLYLLARFDMAVLPGIFLTHRKCTSLPDALRFVDAPGCASIMTKGMVSGSFSKIGRQWALRFPESCVKGLIVDAVSKLSKDRSAAEASLRFLASNGLKQVVEMVAAQFGDDVLKSISETLSQDHRLDFMPIKPPKIPKFWSVDVYPAPRLKSNNKELPSYSVDALANMMSLSSIEVQTPALDAVIEACDPKSLANFAWAAFEEWAAKGQKDSEWIFDSLTYLGDDVCARKLTPYIRNWPRENGIARARKGLEILAAIGTDVALSQIQAISQKNKYQSVLESAQEMMKRIAVARDLKPEQLEDRLVPDLGLSEKGEIKLNFGSRNFIGFVDAQLKPIIKDASGTVVKALPSAGKDDDKALVKESTATWSDLCKELKPVAKLQLERLELAMVNSRRWSGAEFKSLFVISPLLQNLVKGLVWGMFSSKIKLSTSFMVDAKNDFVDADGKPIKISDGASIGIVHPLLMDENSLETWQKLFARKKQSQPFAQLVRKTYRAADDAENNRFGLDGATVASKALKGLLAMGWTADVADAGWIWSFDRRFSSGYASLAAEPGVHISDYEMNSKEQKLNVSIPDTLNPMEFSELIRELLTLKK